MLRLIIILFLYHSILYSQLLWKEPFDYNSGSLVSVSTTWTSHSGTSGQVDILDTDSDTAKSLRYNDEYNWNFNSSAGRRVYLNESETEDVGRDLPSTITTGAVYVSFLMKVINAQNTTGTYFLHAFQGNSGTIFGMSIFIRKSTNGFQLGINARTTVANTVWLTDELNTNQTYLVVAKYEFVSGTGNDIASLWVNPALNSTEPTPNVIHTNTGGTDLTNIGRIALRQASGIGNLEIDEIRVAQSWSDAPLPVGMINFKIYHINKVLKLLWSTATETQNYGWEIERSQIDKSTNRPSAWQVIGFVKGAGNSNSPKEYSFVDNTALYGQYAYRLKQIDIDGTTSYSDELRVFVGNKPQVYDIKAFPNPFNPTTTIRFELPKAGNVKLEVYDLLGRLVSVLVDEYLEEGIYQKEFDGSKLTSGIYFCVLHANGQKLITQNAID